MKHILVVDDDRVVNLLITRELQKRGYGVLMAYDPVQAAMTLTRSRIDVVIVDVMMPGGSAFDVIKRMKISTRLGPIPIIVISSGMTHEMADELTRHGANRCLKKPLDLELLAKVVDEVFAELSLNLLHRSNVPMPAAGDDGRVEVVSTAS
ncbi:MAG TPA: response regulator [Candidatus Angelobacter sp.]|nr:response regulator [Candidatus Angelobacter sp.]